MPAQLFQIPQWFDQDGAPLSGGLVYSFEPSTTTPKALFTDANGNVALPNPVVLDAAGRTQLWTVGAYRIVVHDSADVPVPGLEYDNLDLGGTSAVAVGGTTVTLVNAIPGFEPLVANAAFPADTEASYAIGRITQNFGTSGGLTAIMIGDGDEGGNIWCTSMGITIGAVSTVGQMANRQPRLFNAQARDVLVVPIGGQFDAQGQIEITAVSASVTP